VIPSIAQAVIVVHLLKVTDMTAAVVPQVSDIEKYDMAVLCYPVAQCSIPEGRLAFVVANDHSYLVF